jgi:hypothetical protein
MSEIDFTLDSYRNILKLAKKNYQFVTYEDIPWDDQFILWRHDCDFSLNRARALAIAEAEEGVKSTYFLNPHCEFYNLFELSQHRIVIDILNMGHQIGLHFDSAFYSENNQLFLSEYIEKEADLLSKLFGTKPKVFSFHNPISFHLRCEDQFYGGLINCYSKKFKKEVPYCSDSNGYWRFDRLQDVLFKAEYKCLQVLTHPDWWQDKPMPPRKRIFRAIYGRAAAALKSYDQGLENYQRKNINGDSDSITFLKNANFQKYQFLDMLWMKNEFKVLFLELWRIYQSQLINLYKIFLCKKWLINKDDVDIFLEQVCLKHDCLFLFSEIFKENLGDIVDFKDSDYTKWLQIKNKIVNSIGDQFLDLEAGCVFMSQLIHKISVWGSKTLSYDGIESPPENYTEENNLSFKPNIEAWFKLKTEFELKDLGKK